MGTGHAASRALTVERWAALPDEVRGELVDGRLEEEEVPSFVHEAVVLWLATALRLWARPRGGWVFGSEAKLAVGPRRGRKPDLSLFLAGPPAGRASFTRSPPDLVVEVVTATARDARRDRVDKARDYAAFGVRWYWVVDPASRRIGVLARGEAAVYEPVATWTSGAVPAPGLDGLTLDVDDLWREVALLEAADADG